MTLYRDSLFFFCPSLRPGEISVSPAAGGVWTTGDRLGRGKESCARPPIVASLSDAYLAVLRLSQMNLCFFSHCLSLRYSSLRCVSLVAASLSDASLSALPTLLIEDAQDATSWAAVDVVCGGRGV